MKIFPIIISTLLITGCHSNQPNAIEQYLQLVPAHPEAKKDKRIQNFVNLYNHMENNTVSADTENTYAEFFYFNDTLVTLHTRQDLIQYLKHTQKQLQSIQLMVLNVLENGEDIFVLWKMETNFAVLGKRSNVPSFGITHLRFDKQGKIILHQDYWDSTNGFFEHIPWLGGIIKWIKKRLHT